MKMRTVYLKTSDMDKSIGFWSQLLGREPHKRSSFWSEFSCDNINLGILKIDGFTVDSDASNFVPVFELTDEREVEQKARLALDQGAAVIVPRDKHPDEKSYVLADPQGNEFEVTWFKG